MTDSKTLPRPPQVTMAGWIAIVGSVFFVIGVWEALANLRSLDTREQVEKMLSESPMDSTGIGVEDWLSIMHTVSLVAAGCATAAAILGWHVMQRSRSARIGLTVVAVPLFFTGLFAGAFLASMVAVSATLLWTRPSRDWFDGIAAAPPPSSRSASAVWPPPTGSPPPPAGPSQQLPPPSGPSYPLPPPSGPSYPLPPPPGSAPLPGSEPPTSLAPPPGWPPTASAQRPAFSTARPPELLQACLVTWVVAGLVLMGCAMVLLALVVEPSIAKDIYEQDSRIADAGLTPSTIRSTLLVLCSVFAVWSLVAIGLAVAAFLGRGWARIALVGSALLASLVCLMGAAGSPALIIPAVACGAAAFLLLRPKVHHWFTDRL